MGNDLVMIGLFFLGAFIGHYLGMTQTKKECDRAQKGFKRLMEAELAGIKRRLDAEKVESMKRLDLLVSLSENMEKVLDNLRNIGADPYETFVRTSPDIPKGYIKPNGLLTNKGFFPDEEE